MRYNPRLFAKNEHYTTAQKLLNQIPKLPFAPPKLFAASPNKPHPDEHKYLAKEVYDDMPELFVGHRAHGASALRAVARSEGWTSILPYLEPKDPELMACYQYLFGGSVKFSDITFDPKTHPKKLDGLVLHPGSPYSLRIYRSKTINPHLGYSKIHAIDKWEEYQLIETAWPGLMPSTTCLGNMNWITSGTFTKHTIFLKNRLTHFIRSSHQLEKRLTQFIDVLKIRLQTAFPQGAHIKHTYGCYSSDSGTILTTDTLQPHQLAQQLITLCEKISITDESKLRELLLNQPDLRPLIIFDAITKPENIIVTEAINIQKTTMGYRREYRVDTLDCTAITTWNREPTLELSIQDETDVQMIVAQLRKKLPIEYQYMSFGADIAYDGDNQRWRLIDLNPDCASGFLKPGVCYNQFISNIAGIHTPLIALLHTVSTQQHSIKRFFLQGLPYTILAHQSVEDIEEAALFERNIVLRRWETTSIKKRPSPKEMMANFKKIYTDDLHNNHIRSRDMLESTALFFKARQANNQDACNLSAIGINVCDTELYTTPTGKPEKNPRNPCF